MKKSKKVLLTIIDGWGISENKEYNAIANAKTPNYNRLIREFPNTSLRSDGEYVGLPDGQFGTSEVNHLTIGSGRVIFQDLPRINNDIKSGNFHQNTVFLDAINHAKKHNSKINLIGIISDGGVHSHTSHLNELIKLIKTHEFEGIVSLHLFTDGRDVPPLSAEKYLNDLEDFLLNQNYNSIFISTVQGRVFLDRDRDWEKTERALNLITKGDGFKVNHWSSIFKIAYQSISSDEQLGQYVINSDGLLDHKDSIVVFHFRADRIYQLIYKIKHLNLKDIFLASFCQPSKEDFEDLHVAFPKHEISNTLTEVISVNNFSQLHIAETEKFAHVTFFFNGERDRPFPKEEWILHESNRFVKPQYNLDPAMQNDKICISIIEGIESNKFDFIVANFSSPDMVGHTGDYHAAVVSAQSVDHCLGKIYESIENYLDDWVWIIAADHGNSEIMWDFKNNQPHTQHTLSKVPLVLVSNIKIKLKQRESLEDIAPTVLDLMDIEKPIEMTGESLVAYTD